MTPTNATSDASARIPAIPFDILELILDNLISNNTTAEKDLVLGHLRTCCLVNSSWVYSCRSRLFKEVEIGLQQANEDKRRRLSQVITNQPSIGHFIRKLVYRGPSAGYDEQRMRTGIDHCLSALFRLPNIRSLDIIQSQSQDYDKAGSHYFGWRSVLDHYISSGQLIRITVTGVKNLPLLAILSSPALEDVTLNTCSIKNLPEVHLPQHNRAFRPTIRALHASEVRNLQLWPLFSDICHQIKHIQLSSVINNEQEIDSYLEDHNLISLPRVTSLDLDGLSCCKYVGSHGQIMFPNLTTLHLSTPFLGTTNVAYELSSFKRLQTLSLTVTPFEGVLTFEDFDWDIMSTLMRGSVDSLTHLNLNVLLSGSANHFLMRLSSMLADMKQKNVLQSLKITLDDSSTTLGAAMRSQQGWKAVADTLANDCMDFSSLRHVTIEYSMGCQLELRDLEPKITSTMLGGPLQKLIENSDVGCEHRVDIEYYCWTL